jgi:flagellar basal-body rod protein FlgG
MMSSTIRQQAATNNMANVSTNGYKADNTVYGSFPELLLGNKSAGETNRTGLLASIGSLSMGNVVTGIETDLTPGSFKQTGNPLDLAIDGEAFFTVMGQNGQTYYTRNGALTTDANGTLVTASGELVLGEGGPITLPQGDVMVSDDGTISVGGAQVGKLRLATFPDGTVLEKVGNTLFSPTDANVQPTPANGASVCQGFIEASNVDSTRTMVEMMSALRAYEVEQRVLKQQDQALGLAVNELGKV